jgi:hypothetical protein
VNRLPQHELFVSERPVHSDYTLERTYARRRIITVIVFALMLGGAAYALWGHGTPSNPADIPTIKSEGTYKQKPAEPGGIDIPHQDVRVYDQLEGKSGNAPVVEHLLPPPETPKESPQPASPVPESAPAPAAPAVATTPTPPKADILQNTPPAKPIATTVEKVQPTPAPVAPAVAATSAPVKLVDTPKVSASAPEPASKTPAASAPAAPKTEALSMDKVIRNLNSGTPADSLAAGMTVVQLASVPDEAQANVLMGKLQQKYAADLGNAKLHLTRADLGSKGIYYRIQSQPLAKDEANRICSSLKNLNAGCILVGK